MTREEIAKLKSEGFIPNKNGLFSVRIITEAGNLDSKSMRVLSSIAEKYGEGYMGFTTRLCVEIPKIKAENIPAVKEELQAAGLITGGTGKRVRPVVACKGTVCTSGMIDTQAIGREIKNKFFMKETLPTKFKIGVVGCPNNCTKASLNDLGFMGQTYIEFNEEKCVNCGKCTTVCRAKAVQKIDKKLVFNREQCVNCGKCAEVCPFDAMTIKEKGLAVFIGGRFGRGYRIGDRLDSLYSENQVAEITEKVLNYFKSNASDGERFANMIERIGVEKVTTEILR